MKKTTTGFTIVELLIVIVVIAILAAIGVVSYGGIQERAKNTQRIAAAKEWQKRILQYTAANGKYPMIFPWHGCLGGEGYPTDLDTNADVDCYSSGNVKHPVSVVNDAFATIGTLPVFPGDKIVTSTGYGTTAGISLRAIDTLDPSGSSPKTSYPMLFYWLYGAGKDCVLRPVAKDVGGGFGQTSEVNSASSGLTTLCIILLPDPATL